MRRSFPSDTKEEIVMRRSTLLLVAMVAVAGTTACDRVASRHTAPSPAQSSVAPQRSAPPREAPAPATTSVPVPRDSITDRVITARIKAEILSDPGMSGTDVSVNTDHGVVSLTGRVKSQEQIALASAHAQREDGVMRVDSQLSVYPQ